MTTASKSVEVEFPSFVHHGHNIRHYRKEKNMKQDTLAKELGKDWTQKKVSMLEAQPIIEDEVLEKVATVLEIEVDDLKNRTDESIVNNIQNNYEGSNNQGANVNGINNYNCTFNPLDEYKKIVEENKKLYEALLKEKDEKIALLKDKK